MVLIASRPATAPERRSPCHRLRRSHDRAQPGTVTADPLDSTMKLRYRLLACCGSAGSPLRACPAPFFSRQPRHALEAGGDLRHNCMFVNSVVVIFIARIFNRMQHIHSWVPQLWCNPQFALHHNRSDVLPERRFESPLGHSPLSLPCTNCEYQVTNSLRQ